jgi:hypothetical protein
MSQLSRALSQISDWLSRRDSNHALVATPGLSRDAIESNLSGFPFRMSEEFYDLYQATDGMELDLSYFKRIYSLDEAIARYQLQLQVCDDFDPHLLPVVELTDPGILVCLQGGDSPHAGSPVLEWEATRPEPGIWYGRLTDMMQAVADTVERSGQRVH